MLGKGHYFLNVFTVFSLAKSKLYTSQENGNVAGCDQLIEEAGVDLFEPSEFTPYSPTQEHFQSLTEIY